MKDLYPDSNVNRFFRAQNPISGFTLVELLVVVGIVGVLAILAVPNYLVMVARGRQSEAKIAIASIYAVERSFYAEWGSYSYCLNQLGFPTMVKAPHYYFSGFGTTSSAPVADCGVTGDKNCLRYNFVGTATIPGPGGNRCDCTGTGEPGSPNDCDVISNVWANPSVVRGPHLTIDQDAGIWIVHRASFLAVSTGSISPANPYYDYWTVDQTKTVLHPDSGL